MKNTTVTFKNKKTDGEKITMLTAYDYTTAKLEDEAGAVSYTHLTLPTTVIV